MTIAMTALEQMVMELLLAGDDPIINVLRVQYRDASVVKRDMTGVGFFVTFSVPLAAPRLEERRSLHFGDVKADIDGLTNGAGFVLHLCEGAIDCLEGYSYDEPWPTSIEQFRASYISGDERNFALLWKK